MRMSIPSIDAAIGPWDQPGATFRAVARIIAMRFFMLFAAAICAFPQSAPPITIVTADIDNFWKAYDSSQPGSREEAFDKLYLGAGSPGLRDFFTLKVHS